MKLKYIAALSLMLGAPLTQYAQEVTNLSDPFDMIFKKAAERNPNFQQDMQAFQADLAQKAEQYMMPGTAQRTTGINRTVPVVFHIVMSKAQMSDTSRIIDRIKTQMTVLNEDFNAENADKTNIPSAFKSLHADMNINFVLAKVDPQGRPTNGYEFVETTETSFEADDQGSNGSRYYCSDAKYKSSGGADAWDTKRYMNVWVVNSITPAGVGGVGTPPPYSIYGGTAILPWEEQGIVMRYLYLGSQGSEKGRVLTHEAGHFFNLFHTFGMGTFDNSDCKDDDGVTDTPPQAVPTQSTCPTFPVTDVCSPASPGIMFSNHMDYSAGSCRLMFTTGQKARIYIETENAGGFRYSLFMNPYLTSVDDAAQASAINIYPNPTSGNFRIVFGSSDVPQKVRVFNQLGQMVHAADVAGGAAQLDVDMSRLPKGTYTVSCVYSQQVVNKSVVLL
jgi:Pregnancy-associated plasma protein-A.